jgi:urease accessory protein
MDSTALLHRQRSTGEVRLRMEKHGLQILREAGSSKCRLPHGSDEAILINTAGGMAGGDEITITAEAGKGASLALTSQAAERVYRTLGPASRVTIDLSAEAEASLYWLPHETILFEGASLARTITADLAAGATFLAAEMMVFGRHAMGEVLRDVQVKDRWMIVQEGKPLHAEAFALGPQWPASAAALGDNRAMAMVLWVSPQAKSRLDAVRTCLGKWDGASAWNGKMVARLVAPDGLALRKRLILHCTGGSA